MGDFLSRMINKRIDDPEFRKAWEATDFEKIVQEIQSMSGNGTITIKNKIIALMGKMGAGKSTVAEILEEKYGYKRFSFGEGVKYYAHLFFDPENLDSYLNGTLKNKPRELYQKVGQEARKIDPDIWIKYLAARINEFWKEHNQPIVIDDLRQPNERLWAYENKIPVIIIYAPEDLRVERMKKRGDQFKPEHLNHETERYIDVLSIDYFISNIADRQQLIDQIELMRGVII